MEYFKRRERLNIMTDDYSKTESDKNHFGNGSQMSDGRNDEYFPGANRDQRNLHATQPSSDAPPIMGYELRLLSDVCLQVIISTDGGKTKAVMWQDSWTYYRHKSGYRKVSCIHYISCCDLILYVS
jgi:hypothetical protein